MHLFSKSSKDFWLDWLKKYKSHRCLWDVDSAEHNKRELRIQAYKELASMAKAVVPEANEQFVRNRINNLRTAYRKEVKKVIAARENGLNYRPRLFYYDLLNSFLCHDGELGIMESEVDHFTSEEDDEEEEDPFASLSPKKEKVEQLKKKANNCLDMDDQLDQSSLCNSSNSKKKITPTTKTKINIQNDSDVELNCSSVETKLKKNNLSYVQMLKKRKQEIKNRNARANDSSDDESEHEVKRKILKKTEDEWDILGRRLATHFRNMKSTQRLLAEKIISDVCVYARLNQLTLHSGLTIETQIEYQNQSTFKNNRITFSGVLNESQIDQEAESYLNAQ